LLVFKALFLKKSRSKLEKEGRENPDYVIACVGGGSNAAGTYYHNEDENIAVEAGLGVDSAKSNFSLGKSRCFMEVKPDANYRWSKNRFDTLFQQD
jgi:tryptophan synthase beta subunit